MEPEAALSNQGKRDFPSQVWTERQEDEVLRLVVESLPHAIVAADAQGRIRLVNPRAEKLLGYTRQELIGQPVGMLVAERFRTGDLDGPKASGNGPEARSPDKPRKICALRKDNAEVPVEITVNRIESPAGRLLLCTFMDSAGQGSAMEKAEWLATFPERNPNPIFEFDLERGTVPYANPAAARLFPDLETEGLRHPLLAGLREIAAGLLSGECEVVRREVMAGEFFLAQTITCDVELRRLRIYSSDISDRKRAEKALRESEELFATSFRLSPDYVVVSRLTDRTVIRANDALCKLWGCRPEEVIGKHGPAYASWPSEEERSAFVQRLQERGECLNHETSLRMADGRVLDFNISSRMITFSGESCILTVMRDITERKLEEVAAARLAAIVESSDDAIIGKDLSGIITSWNAGAEKCFGYPAQEIVGQPITRLIPPDRLHEELEILARIRAGGKVRSFDTVRMRKDGGLIPVSITVSAIKDHDGKIIGASKVARDITEQKRLELERQASEAWFRGIFEQAAVGMAHVTLDGRFARVNRRFAEIVGLTREELQARTFQEITHPEDLEADLSHVRRLLAGEAKTYSMEKRYIHRDGRIVWVNLTGSLVRDTAGAPQHFVAVVEDITERKKMAAALRASEDRLRVITDLVPHGIFAKDAEGRYIYVNRALAEGCGFAAEEILGKTDFDLVSDAAQAEAYRADDRAVIESGVAKFIPEEANTDLAGRTRILQTSKIPFTVPETGERAVMGVWVDITVRKQADAALRESEQKLKRILDTMFVFVGLMNLDGVIVEVNHAPLAAAGLTREDVLGKAVPESFWFSYSPSVQEQVREALARAAQGEVVRNDYVIQIAGGAFITIDTTFAPLRDPSGQVTQIVGSAVDITERKEAEAKVLQLNATLEQCVIGRTAQLVAANKELEAFSYSVSHDLRAPLRAVDGFSQAVLDDFAPRLPEEGQRYLKIIRDGAQKMGRLIDDLLTFSRLGRAPLKKETVDADRLVRSVLEDLSVQRAGRRIDLRIGKLPPCLGDPALLRQVWFNLLSNAFKYSRNREVAVVEIGCEIKPEGNVWFVHDNGTGFEMKYADKLFGVFQRLHRAEEYEGTGVGLALVQRVIHRHGGRVWAEGALERGATFYFTLEGEAGT